MTSNPELLGCIYRQIPEMVRSKLAEYAAGWIATGDSKCGGFQWFSWPLGSQLKHVKCEGTVIWHTGTVFLVIGLQQCIKNFLEQGSQHFFHWIAPNQGHFWTHQDTHAQLTLDERLQHGENKTWDNSNKNPWCFSSKRHWFWFNPYGLVSKHETKVSRNKMQQMFNGNSLRVLYRRT